MPFRQRVSAGVLLAALSLLSGLTPARATAQTEDLTPRLQEIYELRARWLLSDDTPPPIDQDYVPDLKTASWALHHERGKIRYMKQWAQNRGVRFAESKPSIKVTKIKALDDRVRFYVTQSLALGYVYPGEQQVNMFGVGTRHIIELRRRDDKWLIGMEWYTDPLGDDTEVPDVTPALAPSPLPPATPAIAAFLKTAVTAGKGYNREGAVQYADKYCGLAWGCGNNNRYNPRYTDYNGVGGDCTNYVSQVLRDGGGLKVPVITRVEVLSSHLQSSGRAALAKRGGFQELWKEAASREKGFVSWVQPGDLIAYQEKGKLEHFAVVTAMDTRGYPLVNTHTADRYHVPYDLGWDRKTIYWFFHVRD